MSEYRFFLLHKIIVLSINVLVLGLVVAMSSYIFVRMVQGVKMELASKNRKS